MKQHRTITDEQVAIALHRFAGTADRLLVSPGRWLPTTSDEPTEGDSMRQRALGSAQRRIFGAVAPGADGWNELPFDQRGEWWVQRISRVAALAAAAPSVGGVIGSRLPVQQVLGASGAGLVVCALAREAQITDRSRWVWLLGTVVLNRDWDTTAPCLSSPSTSPADDDGVAAEGWDIGSEISDGATPEREQRRALHAVRGLATQLRSVEDLLDERPRGGLVARAVAKAPVAGVAGSWFDERKAMRRAADETIRLLPIASA